MGAIVRGFRAISQRGRSDEGIRWQPQKAVGLLSGSLIGLTILAIARMLYGSLYRQTVSMSSYATGLLLLMTVGASLFWLYHMAVLLSLRYAIDRNCLSVTSWFFQVRLPMDRVQAVELNSRAGGQDFRGLWWPGYLNGRYVGLNGADLRSLATQPLGDQLVFCADDLRIAISPRDPERFLADLRTRQRIGPIRACDAGWMARGIAAWPLWKDSVLGWLLSIGAALNLGLYALISYRYESLPGRIPLHYGTSGYADRIESKGWLFLVAAIGSVSLLMDGVLAAYLDSRERLAAYLLTALSILIQCILWAATLGVLS